MEDRNDNKIGKWSFDVWLTESGNLGFTVYEPGKSTNDEDAKFIDIRIAPDKKG